MTESGSLLIDGNIPTALRVARDALIRHLLISARMIDYAISAVTEIEKARGKDPVSDVTKPLMQAFGTSTRTLCLLARPLGLHTRDCYSVSRSVIEGIVNVSYILAEGVAPAERMIAHAHQREWRGLKHTSTVGGITTSVEHAGVDHSNPPASIAKALAEFTTKKGRPVFGWTDLSIGQRIDAVAAKAPSHKFIGYAMANDWLYPLASEMTHGSLYAWLHFMSHTPPLSPGYDRLQAMAETLVTQLMALSLCYEDFFFLFSKHFNKPRYYRLQQKLTSRFHKMEYFREVQREQNGVSVAMKL